MSKTASNMRLVTVKTKYQVTLPTSIRKRAGISVGDFLEANVEGKKITLTPKSFIDRELALALADVRAGRVSPTFDSVEESIAWLRGKTGKARKIRTRKKK